MGNLLPSGILGVLDGGGHQVVNDIYEIGGRHTEDDIYPDEGEVWNVDSDPTNSDSSGNGWIGVYDAGYNSRNVIFCIER